MTSGGVVLLHGTGQAEGPFLNEIEEIEAFALITLGKIDNQPKVGGNHLIFCSFSATNDGFVFIAEFAGLSLSTSELAGFCDGNHRLNLPPQHEFLLWGQ